mgnify:FL=1
MSGLVLFTAADAAAQGLVLHPGFAIGLGYVPFAFSLVFFAVPGLRYFSHRRAQKEAQKENARRDELRKIYASVRGVAAEPVRLEPTLETALALDFDGNPRVDANGTTYYFFEEVKAQLDAGAHSREAAQGQVVFGETVFSSDEEQKSMAEAELEEFDKRLARELGGSHVDFEFGVPETVGVN